MNIDVVQTVPLTAEELNGLSAASAACDGDMVTIESQETTMLLPKKKRLIDNMFNVFGVDLEHKQVPH